MGPARFNPKEIWMETKQVFLTMAITPGSCHLYTYCAVSCKLGRSTSVQLLRIVKIAEQRNFISLIFDHISHNNVMKETSKNVWQGALLLWGESLGSAFHINLSLVYSRIQESQRYFKSESHLLAKHYSVLPSSLSFYLSSVYTAAPSGKVSIAV